MTAAPVLTPPLAADFQLPDHLGHVFGLHEHLAAGPLVLVFYRGHWCPYCRRYLARLQTHLLRIEEHRARLAAISPEPPQTSAALAAELGLTYPLLSDATGQVIDAFGARNGFTRALLPHAAVVILDPTATVRFKSIDRNYKKRTTVRTILATLASLP